MGLISGPQVTPELLTAKLTPIPVQMVGLICLYLRLGVVCDCLPGLDFECGRLWRRCDCFPVLVKYELIPILGAPFWLDPTCRCQEKNLVGTG
jgi:hypothetical protein